MSRTGSHENAVVKFPLIEAVKNHDKNEVERLIAEGVDVNEADGQLNTPLLCAIQVNADLNIIKALVESGAMIIAKDPRFNSRSSLFYAVTKSTETAKYLYDKAPNYFTDDSDHFSSILSYFINSLCTKRHGSHPTIDEVLLLLKTKGLTPKLLAKSIVNILLCKLPLLITSWFEGHPRYSQHPMFHLHGQRTFLLDLLKDVIECNYLENYQRKESIKEVLKKIEDKENISNILNLLKEHGPDPNFADTDGNTAFHYAACLPWMGVPEETVKEICEKLQSFGVPLNKKNHQGETPLLLCLSGSIAHLEDDDKSKAMKTVVEVCKFLVLRESKLKETNQEGESVFHLVIKLFQQGFEIPEERVRKDVIDETLRILHCLSSKGVAKKQGDKRKNSPLHLWASLVLTAPLQDYTSLVTENYTFEELLKVIFDHLMNNRKAGTNARNEKEETPLHLCNTWIAVQLLLQKGANKDDKDSSGRPPLLAAASKKTFLRNSSREKHRFYPDVQEEAKSFFETAIEKELDPWAVHKEDESILGFFIKFETYDLSKALTEVACSLKEKAKFQKILVSLLKAICKDESLHTHWKIKLVKRVLSCAKQKKVNVVREPFDACCKTMMLRLSGMTANGPVRSSDNETVEESDGMGDSGTARSSDNETVEESDGMCDSGTARSSDNETLEGSDGMGESGPVRSSDNETLAGSDGMGESGPAGSPENETVEESDGMRDNEIENTLHCKIAKMLRSHGAELSGKFYEKLKKICNCIEQILKNIQVQVLIPWTSRSKTHRDVLDKLARYQEYQEIGESICCHKDPAAGSFGADVFVGINKEDGKEVAIRGIEETQCTQELKTLYAHLDCEHVVRCLLQIKQDNDAKRPVYFVFELMEGNLDDYFKDDAFDPNKGTSLCGNVVKGLHYLHKHDIRHFQDHLKPTSILYITHPELSLKISDFDHSQPRTSTYVWLSPEVLTDPTNRSKSSDMFSCGLLLHYILSKGKHPFRPTDCTNYKSDSDIVSETEDNIKDNNMVIQSCLSSEAIHLAERMLENDRSSRPTARKALDHPLFWSKTKKVDLLVAVGNQPEFECPRAKRTLPLTAVETDLETSFGTRVKYTVNWNDPGKMPGMPAIYAEMTKKRKKYKTNSVVELVRFIRNAYAHVSESTRPTPIRNLLLQDFVFLEYFPSLVMEVYKSVTTHGWDKSREEIKYAMNK